MRCYPLALTAICAGCVLIPATARSQPALANHLAELVALKDKVGHSETRIRVEATHRVWAIGLESPGPAGQDERARSARGAGSQFFQSHQDAGRVRDRGHRQQLR